MQGLIISALIALGVIVLLGMTIRVVPQRSVYVVERLGKYRTSLEAGLHILMPFIDKVAYKHSQKEIVRDVPRQSCITKDNIEVSIDGVMYLQVVDPKSASYGVDDYVMAAQQLAQTTLRSVIGKIDLDKTFEERSEINMEVVKAVDEAAQPWGVKVLRYEVADINLPASIKDAMEKQVRAERERRAVVAESEGDRQAAINRSEGDRQAAINRSEGEKQEMINISEGEKMKQINEAEGRARQIELIAQATATGLREVATAVKEDGGEEAVSLRIAEQYVSAFEKLAKESTTLLLPSNLSDVGGTVAGLQKVLKTIDRTQP
ncbi:SPFH domain / Band 7 family protein [Alloalcanivorax dieselolei B5]|uniref:SPFH domain / Band 7 family protein n=1 Tax=Alcanivorax dieselolei (strain DSM 16502 / CGMCC 1.3690 / MCCC 1A00001 / B-5) TaxID=930169 RepID=K0CAA3_ALCDB|nr:slipin family protein [Alloalcanivorax dieselolei]AFT68336.1 SPFH domain / Band 7 family protein [Alloalcanivorax dieselolei B5]GGJ80386.1 paraslipin [Alloalcanivorax dieselolei]